MKDFAADWYPNFLTDQEFPGQARDDSNCVYFTREMLTPWHLKFNFLTASNRSGVPGSSSKCVYCAGKCGMLQSGQNPEMCDAIGFHSSTTADYKNLLCN